MVNKILDFISSSTFLFALSSLILLLNCIKKNNNFFDIRDIFVGQFKVFSEAKGQIIVFYGVPLILSIAVLKIKCIDKELINNIIVFLSIMLSMLFAILSILNGYNSDDDTYKMVLSETYNSVMFQCILCIFALIISFSQFFINNYDSDIILKTVSFILYYLIFTLVLNIFIVLKRMKALFDNK